MLLLEKLNGFSLKSISLPPTQVSMDSRIVQWVLALTRESSWIWQQRSSISCTTLETTAGHCLSILFLMFPVLENNKINHINMAFHGVSILKKYSACQDCHSFLWRILFSALVDIGKKSVQVLLKKSGFQCCRSGSLKNPKTRNDTVQKDLFER